MPGARKTPAERANARVLAALKDLDSPYRSVVRDADEYLMDLPPHSMMMLTDEVLALYTEWCGRND